MFSNTSQRVLLVLIAFGCIQPLANSCETNTRRLFQDVSPTVDQNQMADQVVDAEIPIDEEIEIAHAIQNKISHEQINGAIASLHPTLMHLPIGLLVAAGLFALLGLRGNFLMSDCAYCCLRFGVVGAMLCCVTGWFFFPVVHGATNSLNDLVDMDKGYFWYRTGGLILAALALVVTLIARQVRNADPDEGPFWKLLTVLIACGAGWVGFNGDYLRYGDDFYQDLHSVRDSLIGVQENAESQTTDDF